jgi:hypothetical protein
MHVRFSDRHDGVRRIASGPSVAERLLLVLSFATIAWIAAAP